MKDSLFKHCATLIKGHSFMGENTLTEYTYGLGWVRCQLPGLLGNMKLMLDYRQTCQLYKRWNVAFVSLS